MAKIVNLEVTTIKIKDGSVSEFFFPYDGTLGTAKYIDIDYDIANVVALIFLRSGSGTVNLVYDYGGPGEDLVDTISGNRAYAVGDIRSAGTATYSMVGSGNGYILGAFVRYI